MVLNRNRPSRKCFNQFMDDVQIFRNSVSWLLLMSMYAFKSQSTRSAQVHNDILLDLENFASSPHEEDEGLYVDHLFMVLWNLVVMHASFSK